MLQCSWEITTRALTVPSITVSFLFPLKRVSCCDDHRGQCIVSFLVVSFGVAPRQCDHRRTPQHPYNLIITLPTTLYLSQHTRSKRQITLLSHCICRLWSPLCFLPSITIHLYCSLSLSLSNYLFKIKNVISRLVVAKVFLFISCQTFVNCVFF